MQANFNITDLFWQASQKYPHKTAIIDKNGAEVTFAELQAQVEATAQYFLHKGIGKGDRVLVFVPMSIDLYRTVLALFKMGAVAVFLDEWVSWKRMELCCQVAQCKAFVGVWKVKVLAYFSADLRKIPIKLGVSYRTMPYQNNLPTTTESDTALLTFTTGSTGTPKAAQRTHGFLLAQFNALIQKLQPQEDDIDMPVLPIVLLINLATGTPSVIADFKASKPNTLKPAKLLAQIKAHNVNRMISSPFVVKALAHYLLDNNLTATTLRHVFTGGAPVFPSEAQLYRRALPTTHIEIVYGSTEAEPISGLIIPFLPAPAPIAGQGLGVGKISPSATVKIIQIIDAPITLNNAQDLEALEMPTGAVGEIIVAGKHVLTAYFNHEEALLRNKIFIDGVCWHRTGDSGYLVSPSPNEEPQLYLTGRCHTLITQAGKVYFPFMYEEAFQQITGIEIGTILQIDTQIIAFIQLTHLKYKETAKTKIMNLPIPIAEIRFLKKIPRDLRHNSRIDYQKLTLH